MTIWGLSIRSLLLFPSISFANLSLRAKSVVHQPRSEIGLEVCLGLDDDSHLSACQREGR